MLCAVLLYQIVLLHLYVCTSAFWIKNRTFLAGGSWLWFLIQYAELFDLQHFSLSKASCSRVWWSLHFCLAWRRSQGLPSSFPPVVLVQGAQPHVVLWESQWPVVFQQPKSDAALWGGVIANCCSLEGITTSGTWGLISGCGFSAALLSRGCSPSISL